MKGGAKFIRAFRKHLPASAAAEPIRWCKNKTVSSDRTEIPIDQFTPALMPAHLATVRLTLHFCCFISLDVTRLSVAAADIACRAA